jgi:TonB family protein
MLPLPNSKPRLDPALNESPPLPDLNSLLEQHVQAGFPPDLALDLVLNELVVRTADATHATGAALALVRGDEMVCRAATGSHAPDLGVPLNTRDGLSGACVHTRSPQLCTDTESDPRVDPVASRRLGIRSMLLVPVFEPESSVASDIASKHEPAETSDDGIFNQPLTSNDLIGGPQLTFSSRGNVSEIPVQRLAGVLEVFSPLPNAFSQTTQSVLEDFAAKCARIRAAAAHMRSRPPVEIIAAQEQAEFANGEIIPSAEFANELLPPRDRVKQPYEGWTLILGALLILIAIGFSFMIGSRVGWLGKPQEAASASPAMRAATPALPVVPPAQPVSPVTAEPAPHKAGAKHEAEKTSDHRPAHSDELVVYQKGKVIFRMPGAAPAKNGASSPASPAQEDASPPDSTSDHPGPQAANRLSLPSSSSSPGAVWLAPDEADSRLLNRVEPEYPPDAIAAHRSGNVKLEVLVAADGTVSSVQTLSGDPLLASAAAQAVRNWRYEPYRAHEQPSPFQTDVTLTFSLPN